MQNLIIVILGKKGSGKTTLTKKILSKIENFFILDVLGEYEFEIIDDVNKLIQVCYNILKNGDNFKYAIRIKDLNFLYLAIDILWLFSSYHYRKFKKGFWLVGEECSYYAKNNQNSNILNFVMFGRHFGVNQIYISRNTAEISKTITSQADIIITFKQTEPRHKEVLQKYGFDIEKLDKLKKFEYISSDDFLLKQILNSKTKMEKYNESSK